MLILTVYTFLTSHVCLWIVIVHEKDRYMRCKESTITYKYIHQTLVMMRSAWVHHYLPFRMLSILAACTRLR